MAGFTSASQRIDLLPPERMRAVRPTPRALGSADVLDAVFEVVPDFRATGPSPRSRPVRAPSSGPLLAIERRLGLISTRAFAGLTVVLCGTAFLLAMFLGPSEPAVAPTLGIGDVRTVLQDAAGLKVVAVYGSVVNRTGEARAVPPIRVDIDSAGRRITADAQLAGSGPIAPGETRPFSARLPHSGGTAPRVEISFAQMGASPR
jgi:hypothetical protein